MQSMRRRSIDGRVRHIDHERSRTVALRNSYNKLASLMLTNGSYETILKRTLNCVVRLSQECNTLLEVVNQTKPASR